MNYLNFLRPKPSTRAFVETVISGSFAGCVGLTTSFSLSQVLLALVESNKRSSAAASTDTERKRQPGLLR